MKTLNLYVTKEFIATALIAVFVVTFAAMGAYMLKVFDLIAMGIPAEAALQYIGYIIPKALSFSIPFGILVSIMLTFGRLSADSEITAMRACGVSILQIISPIMVITFLLTCVCLYVNIEMSPVFYGKSRSIRKQVGYFKENPEAILEAGTPIDYENYSIYIGSKNEDNELENIQVFRLSKDKKEIRQDITGSNGKIVVDESSKMLKIILYKAQIIDYDRKNRNPTRLYADKQVFLIDYGKKLNRIQVRKRTRFLSLKELFGRTMLYKQRGREITPLQVELHHRIAMGLSPIALMLLGMPLAIRTSRRETSIGLILSVVLAGLYFFSITIFQAFGKYPELHPHILLWIPNILFQAGGVFYIYRIIRR